MTMEFRAMFERFCSAMTKRIRGVPVFVFAILGALAIRSDVAVAVISSAAAAVAVLAIVVLADDEDGKA